MDRRRAGLGAQGVIVAVTGGSGFIGRRLVAEHLARGDRVRVLTRRERVEGCAAAALYRGDLGDPGNEAASLEAFVDGADVLYHCAGEIRDPVRMQAVHVQGSARLLRCARGRVGRWVQLSSVGAYGPRRSGEITEATPSQPAGSYETTKVESDRLVQDSGLAYSILRPAIVFGAGMTNRSLYQMIAMIDRGLFCFVGPEGASANYVHVDNVVQALTLCAVRPEAPGRVYNLSDHCSMERFVALIAGALGKSEPRLRLPEAFMRACAGVLGRLPGFPLTPARIDALTNRCSYPITRICRELGYSHRVSMQQGMEELVGAWKSAR